MSYYKTLGGFKKGIERLEKKKPKKPLKGKGFERVLVPSGIFFSKLEELAPTHCIRMWQAMNSHGHLKPRKRGYASPELGKILADNKDNMTDVACALIVLKEFAN